MKLIDNAIIKGNLTLSDFISGTSGTFSSTLTATAHITTGGDTSHVVSGTGSLIAISTWQTANANLTSISSLSNSSTGYILMTNGVASLVAGSYTLPAATSSTLGGVITGAGIVNTSGTISVTLASIGAQAALTNPTTGSGTSTYIPKYTGSTTFANSSITDSGSLVTVSNPLTTTGAFNATTGTFAGNVNPSVTNTYSLGTASLLWSSVYATTLYESGTALASKYLLLNGGGTLTGGKLTLATATASYSSINLPTTSTIPTSPTNGDIYATTDSLYYYSNSLLGIDSYIIVNAVSVANIATLSGTATVDGVSLVAGNLVLLAGQTTASQNGVYVVSASAWSRATSLNDETQLLLKDIYVSTGTSYKGTWWMCANSGSITVGTTSLAINQMARGIGYGAGFDISSTMLSASAPLSYNNTTGVFTISQATTSTNGYLSSTDWNTFNSKISANQSITWTASGTDISGSASGTTTITPSLTVIGIKGLALPTLSSGNLRYNGSAWIFDGTSYLTANQTINITGAVTGSGTTSISTTLASSIVGLSNMANLAANSIIGNNTASAATPIALTIAQTQSMLSILTTTAAASTYAPLTGTGASGTWGISITGNAATATNSTQLNGQSASYYATASSLSSYVPLVGGVNISGIISMYNGGTTSPNFRMVTAGNGTDDNLWDNYVSGTSLLFRTVNDANTLANTWLSVTRSGYVPTAISFYVRPTFNGYTALDSGNFQPLISYAPTFFIGATGGSATWYKIATLPTVAGTGSNQATINLRVYAANNYGENVPSCDMITFSTRGSIYLAHRTLNRGAEATYGYITNGSNIELWIARPTYSGNMVVCVDSMWNGSYGNLGNSSTDPGLTYATAVTMYDDRYLQLAGGTMNSGASITLVGANSVINASNGIFGSVTAGSGFSDTVLNDTIIRSNSGTLRLGVGTSSSSSLQVSSTGANVTGTLTGTNASFSTGYSVSGLSFGTGTTGMYIGTADGASLSNYDLKIASWYGIGFYNSFGGTTTGFMDLRLGNLTMTGSITANTLKATNYINIAKGGSDTIGAGSYLQIDNATSSPTSSWVFQHGAGNYLGVWWYNGSGWTWRSSFTAVDATHSQFDIGGAALGTWLGSTSYAWFGKTGTNSSTWTGFLADGTNVWMGALSGGSAKIDIAGSDVVTVTGSAMTCTVASTFYGGLSSTTGTFSGNVTVSGTSYFGSTTSASTIDSSGNITSPYGLFIPQGNASGVTFRANTSYLTTNSPTLVSTNNTTLGGIIDLEGTFPVYSGGAWQGVTGPQIILYNYNKIFWTDFTDGTTSCTTTVANVYFGSNYGSIVNLYSTSTINIGASSYSNTINVGINTGNTINIGTTASNTITIGSSSSTISMLGKVGNIITSTYFASGSVSLGSYKNVIVGAAGLTITLPLISSSTPGIEYYLYAVNACTITCSGSDNLWWIYNGGIGLNASLPTTTVVVGVYRIVLIPNGSSTYLWSVARLT